MTYMPALKDSLVKAAERQKVAATAEPSAAGGTGRRRIGARWALRPPRFGAVGTALGAVLALAVACGALLLVTHRSAGTTGSGAASAKPPTAAEARRIARQIVDTFRMPPGSVAVQSDPSRPRRLGRAGELSSLGLPHAVEFHRFWRVPLTPQKMMDWFSSHTVASGSGSSSSEGSATASASGSSGGGGGIVAGGSEVSLRQVSGVAREIGVSFAGLPHGGTAVRVDGLAAWPAPPTPPPSAVRIPADVDRIVLAVWTGRSPRRPRQTEVPAANVAPIVAELNRLPHRTADSVAGRCFARTKTRQVLYFYRGRSVPVAWTELTPQCPVLIEFSLLRPRTERAAALLVTGQQLTQLEAKLPAR